MDQVELARTIETTAYRSWKPRECVEYDGWELRFADGFSRRGNSVYPIGASTLPHDEKLDWCRRWYDRRDLDLVFRQTVATEPGLDDVLDAAGFTMEGRTHVMVGAAGSGPVGIDVSSTPHESWWDTTATLWGFDLSAPGGWSAIIDRIDLPAGFVCVPGEAAGLAIVDGSWMGLFEIVVAEQSRRLGLGTAVTQALVNWGSDRGAEHVYMQVVADNEPAIALYESLGFTRAYTYWYRRDQARSAKSPA